MSFRNNLTSNLCAKFLTVKGRDPSLLLGQSKRKSGNKKPTLTDLVETNGGDKLIAGRAGQKVKGSRLWITSLNSHFGWNLLWHKILG